MHRDTGSGGLSGRIETEGRIQVAKAVADTVRSWIADGQLQPGDKLPSQRDLSERLDVSRPSLREALSVLETQGLLRIEVGRGVFVERNPAKRLAWRFADQATPRQVYEARIAVETAAASLAARARNESSLRGLSISVSAMQVAAGHGDVEAMASADASFHDLIIDACGNPIIATMYRAVRDMMVESQALPMIDASRLAETWEEHVAILAAIRAQDCEAARRCMALHIVGAAARFGIELAAEPDPVDPALIWPLRDKD